MEAIAKVFMHGNSQAVRLPKKFRFSTDRVFVRKNESTGEITLSPHTTDDDIDEFFALLRALPPTDQDFLPPRDNTTRPDPFEGMEP